MDIISDTPYREIYYDVPTAWGGNPGDPINRPQPSDFVEYFFRRINNGFFVDVGANDGIIWNNTLGLENRGWTGICIEPHPDIFEELTKDKFILIPRPFVADTLEEISKMPPAVPYVTYQYMHRRAECIQVAISDKEGKADFLSFKGDWDSNMLSGLVDTIDHKQREREDFKKHLTSAEVTKVECKKLQTIFDERGVFGVHYLSIDVEGGEINVLNSIDFDKTHIDLISVEANFSRKPIDKILKKKGYKFIEQVESDCFYQKS